MAAIRIEARRSGKTERLIAWLLEGKPIISYPGWSRAIVCCCGHKEVIRVAQRIRELTQPTEATYDGLPVKITWHELNERALADLRKAVWSLHDLDSVMRGSHRDLFEYAVDDAEHLLFSRNTLGEYKRPAIVVMSDWE